MDSSITLIGMASVISAGLSIGIGAIGPAIGEGRAVRCWLEADAALQAAAR